MDIELSDDDLKFREQVRDFLSANQHTPDQDYFKWRIECSAKAKEKGGWDVLGAEVRRTGLEPDPALHMGAGDGTSPDADRPALHPGHGGADHHELRQRRAAALPAGHPRTHRQLVPGLLRAGCRLRPRELKTKAELSEDGTHYVVNGSKIWTTMAHIADWIFCLTRTSSEGKKQEGITFLLFPMKQEGIEIKPIITLGGSHTVTVHFTDVKVPVENRIGEEGKGWTYAKGLLAHERTGLAGVSRSIVGLRESQGAGRRP